MQFYQSHNQLIKNYYKEQIKKMRGIQINNYFNNHITLNNKKLAQPHNMKNQKNKNNIEHQEANNHITPHGLLNKSPPSKNSTTNLKKRTNTLIELKKQVVQKRSISTQRHRNAASNRKKEEPVQFSSQKEQQPLANMSSRKLNHNKGGLGKRSKSTIIKTSTHAQTNNPYILKKQPKKVNSNPTNQSIKQALPKSKKKKSSKGSQIIKQNKIQASQSTLTSKFLKKQLPPYASKQSRKQKLTLKIDKILEKAGKDEKKTGRKAKQIVNTSGKKPLSAREKKSKKSRFIQQLKQRYENQPIFTNQIVKYPIKLQYQSQNLDNQFLSVMTNLQKVLNSVSSKQKLKKQLDIINNKLNQFRLHSKSNYQGQPDQHQHQRDLQTIQILSNNQINSDRLNDERNGMKEDNLDRPINNLYHEEQSDQEQWDEQAQQQQRHQNQQALSDIKNVKFNEQILGQRIQILNNQNDVMEDNSSDQDDLYLKIHRQEQKNPLINKKQNIFFIQKPTIQQEEHSERKKEIELLKRFKIESAKMLQKVGISQMKGQNNQVVEQHGQEIFLSQKRVLIDNASGVSQSISNNSFKQDKYPLASSLSPKFDQFQMINAITLKQKFLSSKHDKMSELVKKMFQKQLVSPKSYEFQMRYLNKKYQQQNLVLQSFKKQAQQLSSMLSQIKKDKQQIKDIDELIRNEKWEEAQKLVIKSQIKQDVVLEKIIEDEEQHKWKINQLQKEEQVSGWQREEGWQRVRIQKHEVQNNQFVEKGELTNRRRSTALSRLDIDQQCGHTEQSEDIMSQDVKHSSDQECIYYNQENDEENVCLSNSGGLIRLVQIPNDQGLQFNDVENVIHNASPQKLSAQSIQKNASSLSMASSQVQRKGFTTNLYFIKQYCIALCQFVRDNEIFKTQFKANVSKPLQYILQDTLNHLRNDQSSYPYLKRSFKPSIPITISNQFNNQYQSLKFHSNNKNTQKYQFQKDLQLNFAKMICDSLNQSLDNERPGGLFGKALPWKSTSKHLKNHKHFNKEEEDSIEAYDLMFGVAIARIIQWGSCLCGFLPDTVQLQNTQIDDNYVNHIRQSRMAFLLQKMMAEQQSIMTNFQLQQTQIYYNLSELIQKDLFKEVQEQLACIFNN